MNSILCLFSTLAVFPLATSMVSRLEPSKEFYLKTHSIYTPPGCVDSHIESKDGLYLTSYHTGAGLSDITFTSDKTIAAKAFLNGTVLQFDYNSTFPWGMFMVGATNYAGWEPVQMNAGYGSKGLYFNDADGSGKYGLKWNPAYPTSTPPASALSEAIGWLACDWYHGVPQLFWAVRNGVLGQNATVIDTCSAVELIKEPVSACDS